MGDLLAQLRRRNPVKSLLIAAILVFAAQSGDAQTEFRPDVRFRPVLLPKEFEEIVERLEFANPDGEEICRFLYDQYFTTFKERADEVQRRAEDQGRNWWQWRNTHPGQEMPTHLDYTLTWRVWDIERDQLEAEFLEQVDALMEPHQMTVWRAATRSMRRKRLLQDAGRDGVHRRYDLKAVIEDLGIDTDRDPALADTVASYEDQIDAALRTFRRKYEELRAEPIPAHLVGTPTDSPEYIDFLYDGGMVLRRLLAGLENVTRTHLNPLASALGDDEAAFRQTVYELLYPAVFRESPVEYLAQRLREIETDAGRREALNVILTEYDATQHEFRYMIVEAWERWETIRTRERLNERMREMAHAGTSRMPLLDMYPDRDLWRRNRRLVYDTCKRLRDLFSDEEFEDLPADVRLLLSW